MQKTVVEVLHIKSFGGNTSLENPNFEYDKTYGCMVSGFPIHELAIGGALTSRALTSRSQNLEIAVPVVSLENFPAFIWFENVTRSYWR